MIASRQIEHRGQRRPLLVGTPHLSNQSRRGTGVRIIFLMLAASPVACGDFGLPVYQAPATPRPDGASNAGILDIVPKFGRAGDSLTITVVGLHTTFTSDSFVTFPDEPNITMRNARALDDSQLEVDLDIGIRAVPGVHPMQVTTLADGTMTYAAGFTVVE